MPATTTTRTEMPTAADSFVNSVGVCTHFGYFTTPYYTAYSTVLPLLQDLGLRHIRDSLDNHGSTTFTQRIEHLAGLGIHTDAVSVITDTAESIRASLALMPTAVEAVEGPNEYDLTGDADWIAHLRAFQKMLYPAVKSAADGAAHAVYGPSITSYNDALALGNLSGSLDEGTMHDYFGNYNPGNAGGTPFPVGKYNTLAFWMGTGRLISGSKPLVTTETGYETATGSNGWVTPSVQARYEMRTLLLQWNAGVERTYLYELLDEGGQTYGLLESNLVKQPVYGALETMLHNLTDEGPGFALKPLTYSITASSSVAHTLLQKRDGSYRFMCWLEVPQTDPKIPSQTVVLKPSMNVKSIVQYRWQDNGTVEATPLTRSSSGTITFTLTDRVSEIELVP